MVGSVRNQSPELGSTPSVTYNRLFLQQDPIFSSEGVPILRVVSGSLRSRFHQNQPARFFFRMCRIVGLLLFCGSSLIAWAQQDVAHPLAASPQNVITQIRVIGNRRIPRETVLARLFYASWRCLRSGDHRARLQLALEYRILRESADRPGGYAQGHHSRCDR